MEREFGGAPLGDRRRRLIDQPDDSAVTLENILQPHREQSLQRMQAHSTVLCIHDMTESTLWATEEGLPLGLLRSPCGAPEIPKRRRPAAGSSPCGTDILEVFDTGWGGPRRTHLLIRARNNRRTTEELKLFDGVRASEPKLKLQLTIDRQRARPKKSKPKARPRRPERVAKLTLRYQQVELYPPKHLRGKETIPLRAVHVPEEHPPAGVKLIEWLLLTTMEVVRRSRPGA